MLRKILLLLLACFVLTSTFAQQRTTSVSPNSFGPGSSYIEPCASEMLEEDLLRSDSNYVQFRKAIEIQTQRYIQRQQVSRGAAGIVYTIPVVFHIMHEGEAVGDSTNISYAQALSCIAALNRDFRRTNADGGIAQSGPLGVDAEIEFCIARRDPNGDSTGGVTRHDMSGIQGYLDSGVYHNASLWRHDASMKAMIQWDPAKYLNVWVVNKIRSTTNIYAGGGGGVIGYATFPGGSASRDGVVIRFSATGNDPTGTLGYNLWFATDDGRVLTHELGHYLNLYHTFSGTSSCTPGTPCATTGDRCCDTPPTTVGMGNNCTTPVCPLENKENYMQYQNGTCASDFTPNQVSRMRAVLASTGFGGRNALVTNNNCIAPPSIDLRLDTIFIPLDTICSTSFIPRIVVCNISSTDSVVAFDVKYQVDAGTVSTFNWTGNLQAGECDTFNLPVVTSTNGAHTFTARVDSVNLNGVGVDVDVDPSNNAKTNSFLLSGTNIAVVQIVTACDSFVSPSGKVWKTTGTFSDTLSNRFGCDSLLSYSLTIDTAPIINLSLSNCDSVVSPSGKIYRISGIYADTVAGTSCDSIFNLTVTIDTTVTIINPLITDCDSTFLNGRWYYTSQTVRDTVTSASSCDTIFVDTLYIKYSTFSIPTLTVCDSLSVISGKVFRTSGIYDDTVTNSVGCDSLIKFYLTVNYTTTHNLLTTACDSFISPTGKIIKTTSSFKDTISNSTGCDSIISIYVVVDTPSFVVIDSTICHDDSVVLSNGTVLKTSGTYFDTIMGMSGNNILYSEDFESAPHSFTLNTNDTNAITPGAGDNAWIVNNNYTGGTVLTAGTIPNTPAQNVAITGNVNSNYLHIHSRYAATWSFPAIRNANYIDANILLLGGQNGLNFSKMTNDISTLGDYAVSFEMYYLCRGSFGRLYYSTNSGATWTRVGGNFNNKGTSWSMVSVVDTAFANKATLRFAVGFNNTDGVGSSPGFAVDQISIRSISTMDTICDSITQINLTVVQPYRDTLTDTVCDSTVWRGKTYTNSGVYLDTVFTACDSIFMLNLQVDTTVFTTIDTVLCPGDSIVLASSVVAKVTGTYLDTFLTARCDSIVRYNVAVLSVNDTIINDTICANQTYVLPGGSIPTVSGTYRDTLVSVANCDSIVITNLLIKDTSSSTQTIATCDSLVSPSGKVWRTSGVYQDTIPNSVNCDSLMTFNLTISTTTYFNETDSTCDSLVWRSRTLYTTGIYGDTVTTGICDTIYVLNLTVFNAATVSGSYNGCDSITLPNGTTVYFSGTYRDTLMTVNGCDSINIYQVTMRTSKTSSISVSSCGDYTSPSGKTYTATGLYSDTIPTSVGCDSIISINLTVIPITTLTVSASGCDTFRLPNGSLVTTTGTYRDTLTGSNGCDSVIVTNLILGQSSSSTQTLSLCAGQTVTVGTNVYGATGTYRDTFSTSLGCDSIIVTNLTINPLTAANITSTSNLCQDAASVVFTATPAGGTWAGGGINPTTGLFNPTTAGAGTFIVTYTAPGPCGEIDSATVVVFSTPSITVNVTDDECDQSIGAIDVTVNGGTAPIAYAWSSGETTQDLSGLKKGSYTLTVTDANLCTDSETVLVENITNDDCDYNIFVPNIFSPDGNGQNDVLFVDGSGIETVEIVIYNRWGNLIFSSTSLTQGWDGTYKGKQVNQGVFVYYVKGKFVDGKAFEQKGTITLVR